MFQSDGKLQTSLIYIIMLIPYISAIPLLLFNNYFQHQYLALDTNEPNNSPKQVVADDLNG
jgi:hypothetical protein